MASPRTTLKPNKRDILLPASKVNGHASPTEQESSAVTVNSSSANSAKDKGQLRKDTNQGGSGVWNGKSGYVYNGKNSQRTTSSVLLVAPVNAFEATNGVKVTNSPSSPPSSSFAGPVSPPTVSTVPATQKDKARLNQKQDPSHNVPALRGLCELPNHMGTAVALLKQPPESRHPEAALVVSSKQCDGQISSYMTKKTNCLDTSAPASGEGKQSPLELTQKTYNGSDAFEDVSKHYSSTYSTYLIIGVLLTTVLI